MEHSIQLTCTKKDIQPWSRFAWATWILFMGFELSSLATWLIAGIDASYPAFLGIMLSLIAMAFMAQSVKDMCVFPNCANEADAQCANCGRHVCIHHSLEFPAPEGQSNLLGRIRKCDYCINAPE